MKYSKKFTLEISMDDFYKMAKPVITDKKQLHKAIKQELMQTWHGIVEGTYGGAHIDDWRMMFYKNLVKDGIIYQTQKCIDTFGKF